MRRALYSGAAVLILVVAARAETWPAAKHETLHYTITWPSGLDLGEATMSANFASGAEGAPQWVFEFRINAALPGFQVDDHYRSTATSDLCSRSFAIETTHGARKRHETTQFNQSSGTAVRETVDGGKSEMPIPACAKDALTFLYFVRSELLRGRIPATQTIFLGAPYEVSLEYGGVENATIDGELKPAEKFVAKLKGPASQNRFEVLFARDAGRTPLLIRVPFEMGQFSMVLVP